VCVEILVPGSADAYHSAWPPLMPTEFVQQRFRAIKIPHLYPPTNIPVVVVVGICAPYQNYIGFNFEVAQSCVFLIFKTCQS
jgi:hypothetical protein